MTAVRVAIIDVGANTLRLLVAASDRDGRVDPLREDKRQLGLGEEIERNGGRIGADKLDEAAAVARLHVRRARKLNADAIEILVTSPGRQAANGDELVQALSAATGAPVTVLSAEAEGELGWLGAVTAADDLPESIGVCDVGGGSVQLVIGTLSAGPAWARSVDIGSLRLTRRTLPGDPPTARQLAAAADEVAHAFTDITPPLPQIALATGGTARALRRIVGGRELSQRELHDIVETLGTRSSRQISKEFGVDRARARTLTAGTIVLSEVQRRLGMPLLVAQGGIREGAASELLAGRLSATG
jgi:exopolyphosphatase/guanosine-5'-triphosphate,3'-diphosphate pyrophosphatase